MAKIANSSNTAVPPTVDFTHPAGEPALTTPDSVSWRVFKNPVAFYISGIAAVLLELAKPRIRSGIWDHTKFRVDPLARMKRTGVTCRTRVDNLVDTTLLYFYTQESFS
jgi:uncharacterized protein (DUF2236 family)